MKLLYTSLQEVNPLLFVGQLTQTSTRKNLAKCNPGLNCSVNLLLFTLPADKMFVSSFILYQAYYTAMASAFVQVTCQLAKISWMIQQLSYISHGAIKSYLLFNSLPCSWQFNYFTAKLLSSCAAPWEPHNMHSVDGHLPRQVRPLQLVTSLCNYLAALKIACISRETSQTLRGISLKYDASSTILCSYNAF